MAAWFPFWTKDQLRRRLENLITPTYLIKDRFNEKGYDRTSWWTLDEEAWAFYEADSVANVPDGRGKPAKLKWQESQMDVAEKPNQYQVLTTVLTTRKDTWRGPPSKCLLRSSKKGAPDRDRSPRIPRPLRKRRMESGPKRNEIMVTPVAKWTRNEPTKKQG